MKKNLRFRLLALLFAANFAASPVNATEASFLVRNKKAIIVAVTLFTGAASLFYFRDTLGKCFDRLLDKKAQEKNLNQRLNDVLQSEAVVHTKTAFNNQWDRFKAAVERSEVKRKSNKKALKKQWNVINDAIDKSDTAGQAKGSFEQKLNFVKTSLKNTTVALKEWCNRVYGSLTVLDEEVLAEFQEKNNLIKKSEENLNEESENKLNSDDDANKQTKNDRNV